MMSRCEKNSKGMFKRIMIIGTGELSPLRVTSISQFSVLRILLTHWEYFK